MLDINFNESGNELDKLNEACVNLFNDEDHIGYEEMTEYFNRVYFKNGKRTLLPEKDDIVGGDTLENMQSIELDIPRGKKNLETGEGEKMPSGGLARVCGFYNTYIIENHSPGKEGVKLLNAEDHLGFHKGKGDSMPDLITKNNRTADVKFKNSAGDLPDTLVETSNHDADMIVVYNFYNDTLYVYEMVNKAEHKYKKLKDISKIAGIKDKLIPPSIYNNYYSGDKIFSYRPNATIEEGVDPTTLFDNPRRLSDLPDQDFIDAGLNKKEYVDKAGDAGRQKKYGTSLDGQSHAATNETARKKAEDDFNYALKKLGDVRRYPNKYGRGYYDAPEGVFDLDNFHVAFDKFFEDHDLLKIFDKDGKLKMKGSGGDISKLDKNEAPAKALINLGRAQFSGDKIFKSEGDAQEAKKAALKKAEEDRQDGLKQEYEDIRQLQKDIEDSIENSVDGQTLKKIYADHSKKDADKLSYEVRVMIRNYSSTPSKIETYRRVVVHILNAIGPGNNDKFDKMIDLNIDLDVTDSPDEVVKQLSTVLPDLGEIYEALMYLRESGTRYTRSATYSAIGNKFNYIIFRNPDDKKFYRVKKSMIAVKTMDSYRSDVFSSAHEDSPYYLSIYDDSGQVYDVDYDISGEPVAAKLSSSSAGNGNYKHGSSASAICAFNLTYGEQVLEDNNIHFKDYEDSCTTVEVKKATSPVNKVFEFMSEYNFFCDSSD